MKYARSSSLKWSKQRHEFMSPIPSRSIPPHQSVDPSFALSPSLRHLFQTMFPTSKSLWQKTMGEVVTALICPLTRVSSFFNSSADGSRRRRRSSLTGSDIDAGNREAKLSSWRQIAASSPPLPTGKRKDWGIPYTVVHACIALMGNL